MVINHKDFHSDDNPHPMSFVEPEIGGLDSRIFFSGLAVPPGPPLGNP